MAVDFKQELIKQFGSEQQIPIVKGSYPWNMTSTFWTLTVDPKDLETFSLLFYNRPQTDIGKGELALYWLYGKEGRLGWESNKAKYVGTSDESHGADLEIHGNNVEVKAYDKGSVKLGAFQRQKEFNTLINIIFSIYNLVNDDNEMFNIYSFNFDKLVLAADQFCLVRHSLTKAREKDLKYSDKNVFDEIKIFTGILRKAKEFDTIAKNIGMSEIACYPNKERPGGELIASKLLAYGAQTLLKEKPGGKNGYMAIAPSKFINTIKFVQVIKDSKINLSEEQIKKIPETVVVSSATMFINFEKLFS